MPPLGNSAGGGPPMSPPLSIIQSADISISHSNASTSTTFNSGAASSPNYASNGAGVAGGGGIALTGNWSTLAPLNGIMHKVTVHTNIVAADITTASSAAVTFEHRQAFLIDASSATFGSRNSGNIISDGRALTTGPSYSGDIGDIGTYILELDDMGAYLVGSEAYKTIGANYTTGYPTGIVTNGYWAWLMVIHANYPTKTYKFRFDLEYY